MSATHLMSRLSLQMVATTPASGLAESSDSPDEFETCCSLPPRDVTYSPPPSPTRMSSVPRFDSPALYYSPHDTPSLLDETLPSSLSSPFIAHTPMPYTTTRDERQDSTPFIGLGFTGLLMHDGSMFDGMGPLPKHSEHDEPSFFMNDSSCYTSAGDGCPEHQEDAWRRRMSVPSTSSFFAQMPSSTRSPFSALWSPTIAPLGCSSPADRAHSKPSSPMPTEPDMDDVFFTRSPMLGSPFVDMSAAGSFGFLHAAN